MRTSVECLAKAEELLAKAASCGDAAMAEEFEELAREWRHIASLAKVHEDAKRGAH